MGKIQKGLEYLSQQLGKAEDVQKEIRKYSAPDDEIAKGRGGEIIVKGISEDAVKELNKALKVEGYKGEGLSLGKLSAKFFEGSEVVDMTKLLTNIRNSNKELFKYFRRPKQSIEAMVKTAEKIGFNEITYNLLNRPSGSVLPVEETLGGLIAMMRIGQDLEKKSKLIIETKNIEEKKKIFKEFKVLAGLQSNLVAQVSGNVSEYGRGLGAISALQKLQNIDLTEYVTKIDDLVNNLDENTIDFHAHTYLSLPQTGKAEYIKRNPLQTGYDGLMELYINGILSSPVTHIVNMAGNAGFQIQQAAETGLASVIGSIRTLGGRRGKIGDRVYKGEALAEAHGMAMALTDAFKGFGSAMITGEAGDFATKIDLKRQKVITKTGTDNIAHILKSMSEGDLLASTVDMLGVLSRLPGRFLGAEDEFFKVISERAVLYREAYRESQIKFENAIKSGSTKENAKKLADSKYAKILIDPPVNVKNMMGEEAKIRTFQNNPEGIWGDFVRLSNVPFMKIIIPFSKTPTNIMKQAFDRTFNYSSVYKAYKSGSGREFDKALAKIGMGNSIFFLFASIAGGMYGDKIKITGSGPSDPNAQKFLSTSGVDRYSISIKQDDGNYKSYTFSRFDPMSAILSMAADYAYYAQNSGNDEESLLDLMNLFKAGTLAAAEYSMNMPFLQGTSELVKAVANPYGKKEDIITRLTEFAAKKVTDVGLTATGVVNMYTGLPIVGSTAFSGVMDRVANPEASNVMLNEEQLLNAEYSILGIEPIVSGFYKSLNQAKSRNPLFSKQLPPRLDFWGKIVKQSDGLKYNYVSPIKISEPEYSNLDKKLLSLAEKGEGAFSRHPKKIGGVELSAEQYNDYVKFINTSNYIDTFNHIGKDDNGFQYTETLLPKLNSRIQDSDFVLMDIEEQYDDLQLILQNARKSGKELLLKKYPSLAIRVEQMKD
jgi:hypothetical protein